MTDAIARSCAAALRALDTYEAAAVVRYKLKRPADLQQMRDKLCANAYATEWRWLDDLRCMFGYFGDILPKSVQERMPAHHFYWIRAVAS
jgi:hypothetical protein